MDITGVICLIILFIFGAILGSFACCTAWRMRLKETKKQNPGRWSVCLSCGKRLQRSEKIPILSWVIQRGKCKHCGASIGKAELLSELTLGIIFVALGAFFYPELTRAVSSSDTSSILLLIFSIILMIIIVTIMWILVVYDAKWQKLPVSLLTILNACAIIYTILHFVGLILISTGTLSHTSSSFFNILSYTNPWTAVLSTLGAVAILAGTYFCLYFFSKEKLVGSGDWLIALPIALILGNWWLALLALFLSNLLGSIYGIALKVRSACSKKTPVRQIPFGPFLIIAFVIVFVAQNWLINLIASI